MHRTVLLSSFLAALALPAAAQAPMRGAIECEPTDTRFEHRCLIALTEDGEPVEGAAFLVRADMPEMPMAHNVPPAAATPTDAPGCYEVVLPLEMDGEWLLRLELTEPRRDVAIIRHTFGEDGGHQHGHGPDPSQAQHGGHAYDRHGHGQDHGQDHREDHEHDAADRGDSLCPELDDTHTG